jgi:hypothetical protein
MTAAKTPAIVTAQADPADALRHAMRAYFTPDPAIVGKLPRGKTHLDFVGHADITRILIEVDPMWNWRPAAFTDDGEPQISVRNGYARMWAYLCVHGKELLCVGTCDAGKQDLEKELVGDMLRNGAMRFGICTGLWSKSEWENIDLEPVPQASDDQRKDIRDAFAALDITDAAERAERIAEVIGHSINALTDLTPAEASKVIAALTAGTSKAA